jgi:hypothetical protein
MSANTSDKLIQIALKRMGNETLTADAQEWILNILDRLYQDYRWPFLEKLATEALATGASAIPLPADYDEIWDVDSLVLIDPASGANVPLTPIMAYNQDMRSSPQQAGPPKNALMDLNAMTWRPFPLPDKAYTWQLRYKFKPARGDDPTESFTPVFPNDQIIIQALFVQALEHEDDDRYATELAVLEKQVGAYKAKFNKSPLKNNQTRLSPRFKNIPVLR